MAFHWRDGWFFERLPIKEKQDKTLDIGSVRIYHIGDPTVDIVIDTDSWCSIIASVSSESETNYTWPLAKAFHGGRQ